MEGTKTIWTLQELMRETGLSYPIVYRTVIGMDPPVIGRIGTALVLDATEHERFLELVAQRAPAPEPDDPSEGEGQ